MRRQLILVFLAVSTLVTIAFVVPLGFVVQRTAQDRALDEARADSAAVIPALAAGGTRDQIEVAMSATESGASGRMTVETSQGWTVGPEIDLSDGVAEALSTGASSINEIDGGVEVVAAVATGGGDLSAVRVHVPNAMLRRGQWRAWGVLAGVGAALVALSVFIADRLSRNIVVPTRRLASAAHQLGEGDLAARVEPDGPAELVELAGAFNDLGDQVSSMLVRERELVAELSHRLRTPLTKLRMRTEHVNDPELAAALLADVDDLTAEVNELINEARGAVEIGESCDLNEVAIGRADFWQVLAEDQLRPWSFRPWGGPLIVGVPRPDLVAAIDVLIENVFAHTAESTALSIESRASGAGLAEFIVADAGQGFDDADSARGRSGSGSTGLGLDIATRLASNAGGELRVSQSASGGAAVLLSLPLASATNGPLGD